MIDNKNNTNKLSINDLLLSANEGNYLSQYELGEIYYEGINVEVNYEEAYKWYKLSADQGYSLSQRKLGILYSKGRGINQDYTEAYKWYKLSADQGDVYSQLNIGLLYKKGKGVIQNYKRAYDWIFLSAQSNDPIAQFNLGLLYLKGQGVKQNYEEAAKWYELSAEQGNYFAQYNLGLLYLKGLGVEQNYNKAIKWMTLAANQNDAVSQFGLGLLYVRGQGVEQNYEEAAKWFKLAADCENSYAQFFLGYFYYEGLGVEQNYKEAAKWYKLSADQGNSYSQNNLGVIYELGHGVEQNYEEALKWYKLALNGGYEVARAKCEEIERLLNENIRRQRLHLYERKDVFISWNHLDQKIKNILCYELEKRNLFTIWESDSNGSGNIDEVIEDAILQARSYIIILTGNSIQSKWVEKEVEIIFDKINQHKEYENTIRPIVVNKKTVNGKDIYFDVFRELETFDDNNVFKKLLNYSTHFSNDEINYDKIALLLKENISNSLKLEYKSKVLKKFQRFTTSLNSTVNSDYTVTKIISTTFSFDEGYLDRPLYDVNGHITNIDNIFLKSKNVLIFGSGGTGKSLYLKNFLRTQFNGNKYIFYLPSKDIMNEINDSNNIINIIKDKAFDIYFSNDEKDLLTISSFERIFASTNQVILLIDALDEIDLTTRKLFVEKLKYIKNKYKNLYFIFTSRNRNDCSIISSSFDDDVSVFELKQLNKDNIERMYDILSSKIVYDSTNKINFLEMGANTPPSKKIFMNSLESIYDEIKLNPLLLSNLITIYLSSKKIINRVYDVVHESVNLIIKQIDFEKSISFKYNEYLKGEEINNLLGYLSFQRVNNNMNKSESIIKEYLEDKYCDIAEIDKISNEICNYFRSRSIIVNDRVSHVIFENYFTAIYIYNILFKNKRNLIGLNYIDYVNENVFNDFMNYYINLNYGPWPSILINLLYKLDDEIYKLNNNIIMNEYHLSYKVYNNLVDKYCMSKKHNNLLISSLVKELKNETFYYNNFINEKILNEI